MFRQANVRFPHVVFYLFNIRHDTDVVMQVRKGKEKKTRKMTSGEKKATEQNKNSRRSPVSCSLRRHTGTGVGY